ncbi:MAG TPA: hypothetical protein VNX26_14325 [Candidatus Acidoferrum sp.]|jgi:hypothetical protein|nr:hypothetical protein [Candidatus Acidoferrum sp.]
MMAIDEWLPRYQVSASYSLLVHASEEKTYAALKRANFSDLAIVRGLTRLRGYRIGGGKIPSSNVRHDGRDPFLELAAIPPRELVLGITGRFWRPDGGIVRGLTPEEFADFHREGYAKAVWNFSLAHSDGGTRLSTETRVHTFGRFATLIFRAYWTLVSPFSGLIRKAMLREVKRIAERATV